MAELMEEEDTLKLTQQAILFGDDAKVFMASDLYKIMLCRAEAEKEIALQALSTVDPQDTKKIIQLQSDIARAKSFPDWIICLLQEGDQAYEIYQANNMEEQTE